ncbi:MFS general substrate transporter [Patellaria atrata CBS 101060]|uniref:MFS general substrate transporter n=1 Tax=Patellaria atrata CBS 101060 TaxID=1346257 RepID=A0A9P4S783_9PEZI|nr:MFS general substrate transporter [Patellaria atrata CBS 101060]
MAPLSDQVDEQRPLLSNTGQNQDNGTIERQEAPNGTTDDGTPIADEPNTARLILVMGSVWIGVFLAALDATIVATLSAPISNSFHSFSLLSWLATAYLIANAALQPLSGRLTDIFSRRTGLVFSNIFFAAGTLICGLAQTEWVIIFGRVIAGMGGGGLFTISTFVASDLVPLRKRGLWQGFGNLAYGVGSGLGGVYGGWINDQLNWRLAFLIQVPFIVASGIVVWFTVDIPVKETNKSRIRRVDFLGAFTLVLTLVLLLIGLNSGGNIVPWTHPLVLTSLPLSLICLGAFIYIEDRIASEPVIPVRLLLNRTVLSACLTNWFTTMAVFALLYYVPIFYQIRGFSATQAGLRIAPLTAGAAIGSLGSGLIMKATGRYYVLSNVTEAVGVLACGLIAGLLNFNASDGLPILYFCLGGFAYGSMLTITLLALIAAVDHTHQAVITSASYAFRSTGSTIGITLASAVFQNVLKRELWAKFAGRKHAAEIIARLRDSISEIENVPSEWRDGVMRAYMDALRDVWFLVLGLAAFGALCRFSFDVNLPYVLYNYDLKPSSYTEHAANLRRPFTPFLILPPPHPPNPLRRISERNLTPSPPQSGIISSIHISRNREPQCAPRHNIIDVVSVVLAAGYRDERRCQHGGQCEERAREIGARPEDVQLSGQEEGEVAQPAEGEGGVPGGEGAPAVVEDVRGGGGADGVGYEGMRGGGEGLLGLVNGLWGMGSGK